MPEVILHHYELSPYAEKIRLALGRKSLAWRSVATPMVMPKPDHVELTGGYRRVPVLQIGADIFCDTHCNFYSPRPYCLVNVSSVPEPASRCMSEFGGLALASRRRRSSR